MACSTTWEDDSVDSEDMSQAVEAIMAASTPEVAGEIEAFAMRRAQRSPADPEARLRQDTHAQFDV